MSSSSSLLKDQPTADVELTLGWNGTELPTAPLEVRPGPPASIALYASADVRSPILGALEVPEDAEAADLYVAVRDTFGNRIFKQEDAPTLGVALVSPYLVSGTDGVVRQDLDDQGFAVFSDLRFVGDLNWAPGASPATSRKRKGAGADQLQQLRTELRGLFPAVPALAHRLPPSRIGSRPRA